MIFSNRYTQLFVSLIALLIGSPFILGVEMQFPLVSITFRLLMQPANATLPAAPAAPTLTITPVGTNKVLNWTGGHRLQTAVNVTGTYTNVPQTLSANVWTNISRGGFLSPWTNNYAEPTRFFRLLD